MQLHGVCWPHGQGLKGIRRRQLAPYCSQTTQLKTFGIRQGCSLRLELNVYAHVPRATRQLHNLKFMKSDRNTVWDRLSKHIATMEIDTPQVYDIHSHYFESYNFILWQTRSKSRIVHQRARLISCLNTITHCCNVQALPNSISQELGWLFTFCCGLLSLGACRFYSYRSGLIYWHRGICIHRVSREI